MREEFVSDLKEGMVTAKSVFTPDGLLIVPDGVTLTAPIIRHLDALNVFSIIIMEDSDMKKEEPQIEINSEELVEFQKSYVTAKDKLNDTFEKVMNYKANKKDIVVIFMITGDGKIITNGVHQIGEDFATGKLANGRALNSIPRINQGNVGSDL